MDLQEFVRRSLIEITAGVAAANKENPSISSSELRATTSTDGIASPYRLPVHMVVFDVAVTATTESAVQGKAKGGVITVVSGAVDASLGNTREQVSRLKFSVPIQYHPLRD